MPTFSELLAASWRKSNSLLCVGLDPNSENLPAAVRSNPTPLYAFNREIINATAPWACAFKPQIAHYAAVGAESQLQQTIEYIKKNYPAIPVILDAKRGDIGATAQKYAHEAFVRYQADAVTVNPYLGGDSLTPFLEYRDKEGADKGVFILCRTSNPGSGDLQELRDGDVSVAHHVATLAATKWNKNGNVGLVVGATWHKEVGAIRRLVGDMPLLIPGIGAQGGDLGAVVDNGLNAAGDGMLINVSRGIMEAAFKDGVWNEGKGRDFAEAAGRAAAEFCGEINRLRSKEMQTPAARKMRRALLD